MKGMGRGQRLNVSSSDAVKDRPMSSPRRALVNTWLASKERAGARMDILIIQMDGSTVTRAARDYARMATKLERGPTNQRVVSRTGWQADDATPA